MPEGNAPLPKCAGPHPARNRAQKKKSHRFGRVLLIHPPSAFSLFSKTHDVNFEMTRGDVAHVERRRAVRAHRLKIPLQYGPRRAHFQLDSRRRAVASKLVQRHRPLPSPQQKNSERRRFEEQKLKHSVSLFHDGNMQEIAAVCTTFARLTAARS